MSYRILIVDDSPHIRGAIRVSIEERTGWLVCGEAENGQIAVAMVSTHKPHIVILDLSMPVMNGLDAAREISVIAPGIPMILFTLHHADALVQEALGVGIKHVFSKSDGFGDHVFAAMSAMLKPPAKSARQSPK
ncbi:MAG: response regulator transcription factor [Terriglobales bacterium]